MDKGEDWCHENGEQTSNEKQIWLSELNKLKNAHEASGFREALNQGKEVMLQQYFNEGFANGSNSGFFWGQIQGIIGTLDLLYTKNPAAITTELKKELEEVNVILKDNLKKKEYPTYDFSENNPTLRNLALQIKKEAVTECENNKKWEDDLKLRCKKLLTQLNLADMLDE